MGLESHRDIICCAEINGSWQLVAGAFGVGEKEQAGGLDLALFVVDPRHTPVLSVEMCTQKRSFNPNTHNAQEKDAEPDKLCCQRGQSLSWSWVVRGVAEFFTLEGESGKPRKNWMLQLQRDSVVTVLARQGNNAYNHADCSASTRQPL